MKSKINIVVAMLIFGSIGVFVKSIKLSSLEIAFLRAIIGSMFLVCASFLAKQKVSFKTIKQNSLLLILSGVAIGFNWILLFEGYKYTTISNATLSYYFAPVFVIILAPFVLKEKLTLSKVGCVLIAMLGLFLILNVNSGGTGESYNHLKGIAFGLSAAVLYASVIMMNKFIRNLSGFEATLIQLMVAALVLVPNIVVKHNMNFADVSVKNLILIFVVGIIHTGIAYLLYFTSIKNLSSQSIAVLSYIDPISAVVMSAIFLGETMTFVQIIGGILILGSTFLSERVK